MTAKRKPRWEGDPASPMSAMIDVVFLLLMFFVATIKTEDVLAHLDVARPEPAGGRNIPMLKIDVLRDGYAMNGQRVDLARVDRVLARSATFDREQTVVITCSSDSPHGQLVQVLDLCAKSDLRHLALTSR